MARRSDFQAIIQTYLDKIPTEMSFMHLVDSAMDTIRRYKINLNGEIFLLSTATCEKIPTLKSHMPNKGKRHSYIRSSLQRQSFTAADFSERIIKLDFDRDPLVFTAIVDYVTNNELHVPRNVCPKVFARDLVFWGFSIQEVEACCFPGLVNFLVQQDKINDFHWFLYHKQPQSAPVVTTNWMSRRFTASTETTRAKVWSILDEPNYNFAAKIYFTFMCLFILLSFFAIAASTHEYFQLKRETQEKPNITTYQDNNGTRLDTSLSMDFSDSFFRVNVVIVYIEYVCSGYLFLDYALRIIFFPELRNFLKDLINITDGLALISSVAKITVKNFSSANIQSWVQIIDVMQLLRILRFLRPMSKMTWFRLMYFTLRCCYKDLLLVVTLLLFLSMIFSSMLFYLGDRSSFKSIPEALWFSLITMTTVGYGDVVPKDLRSMLIGCVVAVFGVIVMTMTTPIMVANFHSLYINAIVGQPSTLKKVQKQLDQTILQNSLTSIHNVKRLSQSPSLIGPRGFSLPHRRSTRGSIARRSWARARSIVLGASHSMKSHTASFRGNEADARSSEELGRSSLLVEQFGITQPPVFSEASDVSANIREAFPEKSIQPAAAREKAPLNAPEIQLTVAETESNISIGRRYGCDSHINIVDNTLESSMCVIQNSNVARDSKDTEVILSKGSSHQGFDRADSTSRMQTDVPSEDIHAPSRMQTDVPSEDIHAPSRMQTDVPSEDIHAPSRMQTDVPSEDIHAPSRMQTDVPSEDIHAPSRMQTDVPSEDIHAERPSSKSAKNKTKKIKGAQSSTSSGRDADKDTDSPTSSAGTKKPKKDDDDFNQNMMQRNRLLIRTRHRTWYANYDTSDSDTDSDWTARDWRIPFLDLITYMEKARLEAMCHCRRTAKRRKKRPRR